MKFLRLISSIFICFCLFSCNEQAEPVEKKIEGKFEDKSTGAQANYKGIGAEKIVIKSNDAILSNNVVDKGSVVQINLEQVQGLKVVNEKVCWSYEMLVFDDKKGLLVHDKNGSKKIVPVIPDSAKRIGVFLSVPIDAPFEFLICKIRFYDKNDSTSEIFVDAKLRLRNPDNPKGLVSTFLSGGTFMQKTILQTAKHGVMLNQFVEFGDTVQLSVVYPGGFSEVGGKWSIGCAIDVYDENEQLILSSPDVYNGQGLFDKVNSQVLTAALIITTPLKPNKVYTWKTSFFDKKKQGVDLQIFSKFKVLK